MDDQAQRDYEATERQAMEAERRAEESDFDEDHDTLCGKPHNGGENEAENCPECMAIKLNI